LNNSLRHVAEESCVLGRQYIRSDILAES